MAIKYTYSIATDFTSLPPDTLPNAGRLSEEIQDSAIVTALDYINRSGDDVDIWFKDALSSGDETIPDGTVADHEGGALLTAQPVEVYTGDTPQPASPDGTPLVGKQLLTLRVPSFKRVDDNSGAMNVDGSSQGTPTVVWNGTGASDTGGDWTVTGEGSETAGAMHAGTNGWDTDVTAQNDNTRFSYGSNTDIDGSYDELSFWMQPKAFPPASILRVRWRQLDNTAVGNNLRVDNYTTDMDPDVWQRVQIPMDDFALTADVAKLSFEYRAAAGQHFYFDDIKLNTASGGGPFRFRIDAPANRQYHLTMAVLVVAAPSSGWNPSAFGSISGGLENGLLFRQRRLSEGEDLWKFNSKNNMDLFGRFHPQDDITFANGDLLIGFMVKPGGASVIVTDDDVIEFLVRDELSSLSEVRAYAHYGVEEI